MRPLKAPPEKKPSEDRNQDDVFRIGKGEWQFPDGVVLAVDSETSRRFYCKYRVRNPDGSYPKKASKYSIGPAKLVTLDAARIRAIEVRRAALQGIDFKRRQQAEAAGHKTIPTFQQHADAWMEANLPRLKNQNHREKWRNSIKNHCGKIANIPVDQITTADVMNVLEPIWYKTPVMASEVRGRIEKILGHARAKGFRSGDNPAAWQHNLEHALTAPPSSGMTRGAHKSVERHDMPAFMKKLRAFRPDNKPTARCLEVTILTALRTQEVIWMRRAELDLENGRWVVPHERFKINDHGLDFDVPLSPRCVDVLREQIAEVESIYGACDYVFPGRDPASPITNAALLVMLQRDMEIDATVHGFRASFQTWAENQLREDKTRKWGDAEIGRCLAHKQRGKSNRAYSRDTLYEVRKPIMLAWAEYLTDNVVPMRRAVKQ
jgi:integrase